MFHLLHCVVAASGVLKPAVCYFCKADRCLLLSAPFRMLLVSTLVKKALQQMQQAMSLCVNSVSCSTTNRMQDSRRVIVHTHVVLQDHKAHNKNSHGWKSMYCLHFTCSVGAPYPRFGFCAATAATIAAASAAATEMICWTLAASLP